MHCCVVEDVLGRKLKTEETRLLLDLWDMSGRQVSDHLRDNWPLSVQWSVGCKAHTTGDFLVDFVLDWNE